MPDIVFYRTKTFCNYNQRIDLNPRMYKEGLLLFISVIIVIIVGIIVVIIIIAIVTWRQVSDEKSSVIRKIVSQHPFDKICHG